MRALALSLLFGALIGCGGETSDDQDAAQSDPSQGEDVSTAADIEVSDDSATDSASDEDVAVGDALESDALSEGSDAGSEDALWPRPDVSEIPEVIEDVLEVDAADTAEVSADVEVEDADDVGPEVTPEPVEVAGDQCDEGIVVDPLNLPFEYSGDTTHAADDVSLGGGCATGGDLGAGAPDVIFTLTPEVTAHHVIGMNPATVIGASPAVIYVVETCEDATFSCVGVSGNLSAGGVFSVFLEAGKTYAIVVDGLLPEDSGGFTFIVEEVICVLDCPGPECGKDGCGGFCGEGCSEEEACRPDGICDDPPLIEGNTCEMPYLIESLPFATTGDTWYGTPEGHFVGGSCPGEPHPIGQASNDHFYRLEIETTGIYSMAINTDYDSALYIVEDCSDLSASCIAGSDESLSAESIEIYLVAGQVITIVVDGYGNDVNMNGIYTLQVSQACVASCEGKTCGDDGCGGSCGECIWGEVCSEGACALAPEGDTCLDPFLIPSTPYSDSGDTTSFTGEMGYAPGACPNMELGWGEGSNDVVYAFEPSFQDLYTVTLEASFDSTLYVVTDCLDVAGTCLGADDQHPTEESVDLWMYPGTTYYIVIDGYGNQSNVFGTYTMTLNSACVPQCKFKNCGDDGCGGSCGECEGMEVCSEAGLCELQAGNSCENPYLIASSPMSVEGDSSLATNLMGVPYDACPEETAVRGPVSAEEVWAFTPTESGVYTGVLEATFPAVLYTLTDCALFTTDCFYEENPGPLVWHNVYPECGWSHYDEGQCVGIGTGFLLDGETITSRAYLEAETTYYYVVDGNSMNIDYSGPYTLSLDGPCIPQCDGKVCGDDSCGMSCGACTPDKLCDADQQCVTQEGNSCETPFIIDEDVVLPLTLEGNTNDATNTYGKPYEGCPGEKTKIGAGSRDEVYAFVPPEDGNYEITIESPFQGAVYVLNDCSEFLSECFFKETKGHDSWTAVEPGCSFAGETCLGAFLEDDEDPEALLEVALTQGEVVYIVVDGLGGLYDTFGPYTLTIDRACDPQCEGKECGDDGCGEECGECPGGFTCDEGGQCIDVTVTDGNTCETAFAIDTVEFLGAGDTSNDSDVYTGEGCPGLSASVIAEGARDEVWTFTPEQSGTYLIDINGQAGFEPIIYVVSDCSDETWACVKGGDDVTLDVALEAGVTYFIIVDGGTDPDDPPPITDGGYVLEVSLP